MLYADWAGAGWQRFYFLTLICYKCYDILRDIRQKVAPEGYIVKEDAKFCYNYFLEREGYGEKYSFRRFEYGC